MFRFFDRLKFVGFSRRFRVFLKFEYTGVYSTPRNADRLKKKKKRLLLRKTGVHIEGNLGQKY